MTTITDKKQYPSDQYLNELITNMEFAARAPVEVVRVMAAELQKRREADSAEPVSQTCKLNEPSGNYPVTPDGWISCSERMPNDAQWCVVDAEGGYYVQCWSEGQGWLGDDISLRDCDVIRWMPLPEPPQEMK